jgi:WD40 repeat protein
MVNRSLSLVPVGSLLAVLGCGLCLPGVPGFGAEPGETPPAATVPPKVDALGDPLPPGAVMRLGTTRLRHWEYVNSLTFAPDGKMLVSAGWDAVRAWDVATGKELAPFGGEEKVANCTAFLPDGKTLAAGYDDELVLWDVAGRQPVHRFRDKRGHGTDLLAVSPDGKTLAGYHSWGVIRLWQVETGKLLGELDKLKGDVVSLAFSPDSQFLAASSKGVNDAPGTWSFVTLWEVSKPKPRWHTMWDGGVNSVAFFPDGKTIAVGAIRGSIHYVAVDTGAPVKAPEVNGRLVSVAPDGKTLAVVRSDPWTWNHLRSDRTVRLCDSVTGQEQHCLRGHGSAVCCLAFSADGKILASGSNDGTIILWETATGRELHPWPGHRYRVGAVAFFPDGRSVVTRGGDQTVRLWDLATGKETLRLDAGSQQQDWVGVSSSRLVNLVPSLAYSLDGNLVATWDYRMRSILVWNTRTGKQQCVLPGHDFRLIALAFAPDEDTLASSDDHGCVRLWDANRGKLAKLLVPPPEGRRGRVEPVLAFSPDGHRLAMCSFGGVAVWDRAPGVRLSTLPPPVWATSLAFCHGGEVLAAARPSMEGEGNTIRLAEVTTGAVLNTLTWKLRNVHRHPTGIGQVAMALSADGHYLAAADKLDWDVPIWDLVTGQEIFCFRGHRGPVNGVAFSRDGTKLASASDDGTVLVWDLLALPKEREAELQQGLPPAVLDGLWSDLAAAESGRAFRAMVMLARSQEKAIPLFRDRLRPVTAGEYPDVARLIADLDCNDFEVRDAATRQLQMLGALVLSDLGRALAKPASPEAQRRLQDLVDPSKNGGAGPEVLLQLRAQIVLEWINNKGAQEILGDLSKGEPKAHLTRHAQATLRRLERRPKGP